MVMVSTRIALLAALALGASGCKLLSTAVEAPGKVLNPSSGKKKEREAPGKVQTIVMRFADGYNSAILQATNEFTAKAGNTPEARIQALNWAINQSTASLAIACGANPNANLLDMLVLVKLGRIVHEEYWMPEVWKEADQPMVDAYRSLEEDLELASRATLSPEDLDQVDEAIRIWRQENPNQTLTGFQRLPAFKTLLETRSAKASKEAHTDVFGQLADLVSLDPLEGLKPATREVELARLFGERTLFYAQRAPLILAMQAELLGLKYAGMPEIRSALATSDRISKSAEGLTETAKALPETFRAEREATVKQLSDEITKQREGLVQDLERVNEPTRQLLAEARTTLDSAEKGSAALQGAIVSFDTLMKRFESTPEEKAARANDPPGRPFDVTEYGDAAARVGQAAGELHALLATLDKSTPELENLVARTAERTDATAERILNRALVYGLVLIAAIAIAVVAVRRFSPRRAPLPPDAEMPASVPAQRAARLSAREAR